MFTPTFLRWSAWSGIAAAVCIVLSASVEVVTGETAVTSVALAASPALSIPLVAGLMLRQSARAGAFGAIAGVANLIGLGLFGGAAYSINAVLFFVGEGATPAQTRTILLGSVIAFTMGAILFAISMVRASVIPKVPAIAYAIAFPALGIASRLPESLIVTGVHLVAGATAVWLSIALLRSLAERDVSAGTGERLREPASVSAGR